MTPERWQQVKTLLQEALERPPEVRATFLAEACRSDSDLAREVGSLLAAHDEAGGFIETPALAPPPGKASGHDALHDATTWAGRRVGPYLMVREIGHGGMGAVYLAVRADDEYRKQVAVKVIRSSLAPAFIHERFRHERQILADLDHPNIARLIDAGSSEDGSPYFVMDYVDGLPIDQHCLANHLSVDARLALFLDVCAAVHYAHQHLVVHRDLKPTNVLVTPGGVPKLLDFGIAKLLAPDAQPPEDHTMTGMRVMTMESASPEQVRGERVSTASDVYALGVMLHRLLTGRGPYALATTTPHDLARAICEEDPRRPSDVVADPGIARELRGDLDTIVLKALQKEPGRRYSTVDQFAEDIGRHLGGRPVLAQPDTFRYRTTKFITRHKTGVAAAAIVGMSLVGGAVTTAWQAHVAGLNQARAERRFNDVRRLANSFLFEFHDAIADLPGSTKARELVVRRATEYLDSLASESANDASLQRELAAAYEKFGDVQGLPFFANLGDTAGALKSHQSALALRQALAESQVSDPLAQGELRTTHNHLSAIFVAMKDSKAALEHARMALAISEALQARNPEGASEGRALAGNYHELGVIMSSLGEWKAALDNYQREARVFEALLTADPSNRVAQRNVAIAHKQVGAVLERSGDRAAALEHYRKAVALDEVRARADALDGLAQLDLSYGYASIGSALAAMGQTADGLEQYQRALSLREQVAAADPHDVNAKDAVTRAHLSIGQVLRNAGRPLEAITHFRQALVIASARFAADPSNATAGERLANVYGALAGTTLGLASAAKDPAEAARRWRETLSWSRKSLDIWVQRRAKGALTATGQSELDALAALVAKCEAALKALDRSRPASSR